MNILSFDIEEWYIDKTIWNRNDRVIEYDRILDKILGILDERNLNGTFFCLGGMASEFPEVVKRIASYGHEIGCHSFKHTWINKMSREEVKEDTRIAIDIIEQCIGKKVISYRAPAFSIGMINKWAFEVLAECGIKRDASIFPAVRDFGGFSEFGHKTPTMVFSNQSRIKEFPICTAKVLGKEVAYSGGGYFRFFPLSFVKKEIANSNYNMTYFHIGDLVTESGGVMSKADFEMYFKEPGTLKNRYIRYIKSNLGKKGAFDKLVKLIKNEDFISIKQTDAMIDWGQSPSIVL